MSQPAGFVRDQLRRRLLASAAGIFGKISVDWMLMFSFSSSPPNKWILKDLLFFWHHLAG
jgi:hypothetical protein